MERIYSIFIFGIIFNLLFASFGFAFTTFAHEPSEAINIVLDQDDLWEAGIIFINATTYEIDWEGDWDYFTENNKKFRMQWFDPVVPVLREGGLHIQQQKLVEQYLDTWLAPTWIGMRIGEQKIISNLGLTNGSMITYWENDWNWTRFQFSNGLLGFITTYDNNITRAIEEGSLNVTIGEPDTSTAFDVENFVDWYWDALFNWDIQGIPATVSVFTKIIVILNLASGVMVVRELFKL